MARLSETDIQSQLTRLAGWRATTRDGKVFIEKTYKQPNFLAGLGFVTRVAVLAEKANHHPDVTLTYPSVGIALSTHDAGGLTEKDFALAAKIDAL